MATDDTKEPDVVSSEDQKEKEPTQSGDATGEVDANGAQGTPKSPKDDDKAAEEKTSSPAEVKQLTMGELFALAAKEKQETPKAKDAFDEEAEAADMLKSLGITATTLPNQPSTTTDRPTTDKCKNCHQPVVKWADFCGHCGLPRNCMAACSLLGPMPASRHMGWGELGGGGWRVPTTKALEWKLLTVESMDLKEYMISGYVGSIGATKICGPGDSCMILETIRRTTGAQIGVAPEVQAIQGMRQILIKGWESQVGVAKEMLEQVAGVPMAGMTKTEVVAEQMPMAMPGMPGMPGVPMRKPGSKNKLMKVQMLQFRPDQIRGRMVSYYLMVSQACVKELCTSRGQKVNAIRDSTQCQIKIDDERQNPRRKINLTGTIRQVTLAILCIKDIVDCCVHEHDQMEVSMHGHEPLPYQDGVDCRSVWDPYGEVSTMPWQPQGDVFGVARLNTAYGGAHAAGPAWNSGVVHAQAQYTGSISANDFDAMLASKQSLEPAVKKAVKVVGDVHTW